MAVQPLKHLRHGDSSCPAISNHESLHPAHSLAS